MTSNFKIWEKDPFFPAAEEVQDSADRLVSAHRAWMHAASLPPNDQDSVGSVEFCWRELNTAFDIAKWQLEEFEKEVSLLSADAQQQAEDDTPKRHQQFIFAINSQIKSIKDSLIPLKGSKDLNVLPIVRLDKKGSDELALFLCGSRAGTGDDMKDMLDSCTRSVKEYEEVSISLPACAKSEQSSSSGLDAHKASTRNSDKSLLNCETHITIDPCTVMGPSMNGCVNHKERTVTDLFRNMVDRNSEIATCAVSELLLRDCYGSGGTCIERPNTHHRNLLVNDSSSCWEEDSSFSDFKALQTRVGSGGSSNFWSSLLKASPLFQLGVSKNIFKRWKDGDVDAQGYGKGSCSAEENYSCFLFQDGKQFNSWSEGWQSLPRSSHKALSSRQIVQAFPAVLAAFGLLGLLTFYMIALAS